MSSEDESRKRDEEDESEDEDSIEDSDGRRFSYFTTSFSIFSPTDQISSSAVFELIDFNDGSKGSTTHNGHY